MVYFLLKLIIGPFIKQVKGISNIPKGPCILIMNHASYIDAALVDYLIKRKLKRKVYFLQSREWLRKHWYFYPFFVWLLQHIPTNGSVTKVVEKLKEGEIIGLFTEAFNRGLLLIQTGKSTVRIAPPLIISKQELGKGLDILEESIKAAEN